VRAGAAAARFFPGNRARRVADGRDGPGIVSDSERLRADPEQRAASAVLALEHAGDLVLLSKDPEETLSWQNKELASFVENRLGEVVDPDHASAARAQPGVEGPARAERQRARAVAQHRTSVGEQPQSTMTEPMTTWRRNSAPSAGRRTACQRICWLSAG
jgi:hypothetical protein